MHYEKKGKESGNGLRGHQLGRTSGVIEDSAIVSEAPLIILLRRPSESHPLAKKKISAAKKLTKTCQRNTCTSKPTHRPSHSEHTSTLTSKLNIKRTVEHYSFWLHSLSMPAAVQLLSDEPTLATGRLYSEYEPIFTIYV